MWSSVLIPSQNLGSGTVQGAILTSGNRSLRTIIKSLNLLLKVSPCSTTELKGCSCPKTYFPYFLSKTPYLLISPCFQYPEDTPGRRYGAHDHRNKENG